MRRAIFLDRDDTLIENRAITARSAHPGSLYDPGLVWLTEGAAEACGRLKRAGFALVVVSNQGCVARGECTIAQVEATNRRVREVVLEHAGVELDRLYYCPYHPQGTAPPYNVEHPWRKPNPGMILQAADDLRLELGGSWLIGDAERDVAAAVRAGIAVERTIVVGEAAVGRVGSRVRGMSEAADVILKS